MLFIVILFTTHLSHAEVTFQKQTLIVADKKIVVEIADTDKKRQHGLMFRKKLPKNQGMLFVFPEEQRLSFWMKNTFIPLSIGFFNKDKRLIDIQKMSPSRTVMESQPQSYQSKSPAQFALEVNQGWFEKNKVKIGAKFTLQKTQ